MLITDAISRTILVTRASITPDTIYTYVSRIAYRMFEKKQKYLSEAELEEVTKEYKNDHKMRFPDADMWHLLEEARILGLDFENNVVFPYRYAYYYFVAKYIMTHLHTARHEATMRIQLEEMARNLHVEDYANIVIFFVYLTKDEKVMQTILDWARSLYPEHPPFDLDKHIAFLDNLFATPIQVRLAGEYSQDNNEQQRRSLDEAEQLQLEKEEREQSEREIDDVLKVNMAFKTLQVMGQILRNFPGALQGDLKLQITTESYLLGLRALCAIFVLMEENLTEMQAFFAEVLKELQPTKEPMDQEKARKMADQFIYRLVFGGSFGIIKMISQAVGSEHLAETYKEVSAAPSPLAIGLIDLAIKLEHFRNFPNRDVIDLNKQTEKKEFAASLLKQLVAEYFYLYPAAPAARQRICSQLGIQANTPGMISSQNKRRTKKGA